MQELFRIRNQFNFGLFFCTSKELSSSIGSVRLRIEGLLVLASLLAESLCCVLEQDTLSTAQYLFKPERPVAT